MNVLFLTIGLFDSINQHGVYPDLLRCFVKDGHHVYTVSSREKRKSLPTEKIIEGNAQTLKVRIGNITKTGVFEKGMTTIQINRQYISAIKKHFNGVKFDLILYSTPPITLVGVIDFIKKRDHAKTYLMLKDIFPQNAVDLEFLTRRGIKGLIYRYFRRKEKKLYTISDRIGCMSQANVEYLLRNNSEIEPEKVGICPNCIEARDLSITPDERKSIREKFNLPTNKIIFVYGGNLGKPQDIPFFIQCLRAERNNTNAFFLIVGDGTEDGKLSTFIEQENPNNVLLMRSLPEDDYDRMIAACDIGLIFLDHRFTIPNFPSKLLSYMQAKLPVLACTDPNTDIGKVITEGEFGWWCESDDVRMFDELVHYIQNIDIGEFGNNAWNYLISNYSATKGLDIVLSSVYNY